VRPSTVRSESPVWTTLRPPIPDRQIVGFIDSESTGFSQNMEHLIQVVEISRDDDDVSKERHFSLDPDLYAQRQTHLPPDNSSSTSRKTPIPLAKLFTYMLSSEDGSDFR